MALHTVTIVLESETKDALEQAAAETQRTVADVVREAVAAYLEAYEWQAETLKDRHSDDFDGGPELSN